MGGKILIAFDESENAMRAVKFVSRSFIPGHEITLFNVAMDTAAICDLNSPELTPLFLEHQINFCSVEDKKKELVDRAMDEARRILLKAGFEEKDVTFKTRKKDRGVARDILAEAHSGYDAVVLGRRGLSGIAEFFLGSVSQKVLHGAKDLSVILVN